MECYNIIMFDTGTNNNKTNGNVIDRIMYDTGTKNKRTIRNGLDKILKYF